MKSKLIQVGDLVRVPNENDIPCDMILLSSSNKDGKCFVTTANLDGETNLKVSIWLWTIKLVNLQKQRFYSNNILIQSSISIH